MENNCTKEINKINFLNRCFHGLISSFCFVNHKEKEYLLAGCGNILKCFILKSDKNELLFTKQIFDSYKITKIKEFQVLNRLYVFIIGETEIKYLVLHEKQISNLDISSLDCKMNISNDYILEINLIEYDTKYFLILGYVGNFLEIYSFDPINAAPDVKFIKRLMCQEKCIIYAMSSNKIGNYLNVASGTVFRNIIIWQVDIQIFSTVSHFSLKGHEGVIFDLKFLGENNLTSCSDDRSIRLWTIDYNNRSYQVSIFLGHSSRVWQAQINSKYNILISGSEDSTVKIYDLTSTKIIKEITSTHLGKSIRTLITVDDYLFTGGEDSQIFQWSVPDLLSIKFNTTNKKENSLVEKYFDLDTQDNQSKSMKSFVKSFSPAVKFLKFFKNNLYITSNHGLVIEYNILTAENKQIYSDPKFRCINSLVVIEKSIIFGLADGYIVQINLIKLIDEKYEVQIFNNIRIPFLFTKIINDQKILIAGNPLGAIKIFSSEANEDFEFNNDRSLYINLGVKSQAGICSCDLVKIFTNQFFILMGNNDGEIFYFPIKFIGKRIFIFDEIKFLKLFNDKVTQIIILNKEFDTSTKNKLKLDVLISSKDGKIKNLVLNYEDSILINNFSIKEVDSKMRNDITSIESCLIRNNNHMILAGHHGRNFVIYDSPTNSILHTYETGGNNRSFDFKLNLDKNCIMYAFSDAKRTNIISVNLNKCENYMSNFNIPLPGRLIHSSILLETLPELPFVFLSIGSEDANIFFYSINKIQREEMAYLDRFTKHSGAIRKIFLLKAEKIKQNDLFEISYYLGSVAACSECFLFKFTIIIHSNELKILKTSTTFISDLSVKHVGLDSRNLSISSLALKDEKFWIIYTNTYGNVENYLFNSLLNKLIFHSSINLKISNFIPLCSDILDIENNNANQANYLLILGLTNGIIIQYLVNYENNKIYVDDNKTSMFLLHQAGINDIKHHNASNNRFIFTCGEDSCIIVSLIDKTFELKILYKLNEFHSGPIKSLFLIEQITENSNKTFKDLLLFSGSYDQTLGLFTFKPSSNLFTENSLSKIKKIKLCLAELNCLSACSHNGEILIACVGQGLETRNLSLN
jgi:WD40 repeat protein